MGQKEVKLYRVIFGEYDSDNFQVEFISFDLEEAKRKMIENGREDKKAGLEWYEYSWRYIDCVTIGEHGTEFPEPEEILQLDTIYGFRKPKKYRIEEGEE